MDAQLTSEQTQLKAVARDYLGDRLPARRVAEIADSALGWDESCWSDLVDMGWLDTALTPVDLVVLGEEAGYHLLPAPWFATVALAAPLLDPELRSAVDQGAVRVTVAQAPGVRVSRGTLHGRSELTCDLNAVTNAVVVTPDGVFDVEVTPDVVHVLDSLDGTRRLGLLELDGAAARPMELGATTDPLAPQLAHVVSAAEAVGAGQRALDLAVEHARQREQFRRPIGGYQAVSHALVDAYVELELARGLAYWAASCEATGDPQRGVAAAAAKAAATEAATAACETAIQVHGGLGFTWESFLHRLYKRARVLEIIGGTPQQHRAHVAAHLFAEAGR